MGDKKKKKDKDKKKDRKKEKEDKKKSRKSRHSSVDSDDSSDDSSDSSVSERHHKRDKKKGIKKEKDKKKSVSQKQTPAAASNNPYDFSSVNSNTMLPVIKGIGLPIPPPMPNPSSVAYVPKPKVKEPNIFKLLPKLPYGAVLFAKTIYSGEYLSQEVFDVVLNEMIKGIEQTTIQEQHKKGTNAINKCKVELQKVSAEQQAQSAKMSSNPLFEPVKEKSNRYEYLQKVYHEHMEKAKFMAA